MPRAPARVRINAGARVGVLTIIRKVLSRAGEVEEAPSGPIVGPSGELVELRTPERNIVASVINRFRSPRSGRVAKKHWPQIGDMLKGLGASIATYKRIGGQYWKQVKRGVAVHLINLSRKAGRGSNTKLTVDIVKAIMKLQSDHHGQLSERRLVAKLNEAPYNFKVSNSTMHRWVLLMGQKRIKRYIKPKLKRRHLIARLTHTLDELVKKAHPDDNVAHSDDKPYLFPHDPLLGERVYKFSNLDDVVHVDEKCFFLMHDGTVCRVFPNADGTYSLPANPTIYHKSRMPKVMFLAAVTKPRPEYNFDGKLGIWEFAFERLAKGSNKNTGTVKGVTVILEDVKVDGEAYRKKITGKDGVFDMMREKIWWFKKDAKHNGQPTPEAGRTLYMQQDGASPHKTQMNLNHFASEGAKKGFSIAVTTQSAQSPDFNYLDLAFFRSLQSDVSLIIKQNRFDLIKAVKECFDDYDAKRMDMCCRSLITSYKGCLEVGGGNNYPRHRSVRKEAAQGIFDLSIAKSTVEAGQATLAKLEKEEADDLTDVVLNQKDEDSDEEDSDESSEEESEEDMEEESSDDDE